MTTFSIGQHRIPSSHVYIIAEAGSNHNGDLAQAKRLIDCAAAAGADAVKFQTFSASTLYVKDAPPYDLIGRIALPREWHPILAEHATAQGLHFLSTPFDHAAIEELHALNMPAFKVASFELGALDLIHHIASTRRPVILSTGLATLEDIESAIEVCEAVENRRLALLQCASLYPAPLNAMNLRAMASLRAAFGYPVGLSDHTRGIHIAVAAAALGAAIIEKHFTLNRWLPGPDHAFAIEPTELVDLVAQVRDVEAAMGDGRKAGPQGPEEMNMAQAARRSLVSNCRIERGTRIERWMLTTKRPGHGIKPKLAEFVVGRIASRTIEEDTVLTLEML